MRVHVIRAWPRRSECVDLELPDGACVADAIAASGFAFDAAPEGVAVFGELAEAGQLLRDGDRVELLRPLLVDPKQARRLRASRLKRPD